jgi:hypothetical protein
MVHLPRELVRRCSAMRQSQGTSRVAGTVVVVLLAGLAAPLAAQAPRVHYHHAGVTSPGAIGSRQLTRGGPLAGHIQLVEIKTPHGAAISMAHDGTFDPGERSTRLVGLLLAPVYRLKITGIRNHEGHEVFPTLEIIDRTYPPHGQELRHPIPVEITQDDLELALNGQFVTRVVYIEDPKQALPHGSHGKPQMSFDVRTDENPLNVADELGRPVAILRVGGRVPGPEGPDAEFMFNSPPWQPFHAEIAREQPAAVPYVHSHGVEVPVHDKK